MKITKEMGLTEFEFWSGAKETVKYLTHDEIETVESMLSDIYPNGMDSTQVNDLFWFEGDMIAEWLGYSSFEEIMER